MQVRGQAGGLTRNDLAGLRAELGEELGILVRDLVGAKIHATAGHLAVGLAEGDEAFFGLGLHEWEGGVAVSAGRVRWTSALADFAVKGVALEEGIVLLLLEAARGVEALLVARADVARRGLALRT